MQKILVSACLFGAPVRYDARPVPVPHPLWQQWLNEGRLVSLCPEMAGGLPAPRAPAEILGAGGGDAVWRGLARVVDKDGNDYTRPFLAGAEQALQLARQHACRVAVLKAGSPSCGHGLIYDGRFSGGKTAGDGVTAALLRANGIHVFDEHQLEQVAAWLASVDS
ncbi:DUF523 domain-containing protein [Leeia sp.]|uniref:DUF523 domain-containing protein n=1 Tax=Leeia sp. TaxID=2884678 RepID=UPI0035B34C6D